MRHYANMPPIRLAIANDYEIVVAGTAAVLKPYADRIEVVELAAGLPVTSDVDVILYDTFGQVQGNGIDMDRLIHGSAAKVVVFTWNLEDELVNASTEHGVAGYVAQVGDRGRTGRGDRARAPR